MNLISGKILFKGTLFLEKYFLKTLYFSKNTFYELYLSINTVLIILALLILISSFFVLDDVAHIL